MMKNNGFDLLGENIGTTIYEGLLKLGYNGTESLSIYYDLDLLNHLLGSSFADNESCLEYLKEFITYIGEKMPGITICLEKSRFKVTVSKEGIDTIYEANKNNDFLRDIINTVKTHNFTLDDIISIFQKYSDNFVCEEMDHSEFQYVLYFKDDTLDKFKYCFSFDQMGGYYHRLLDYNYEKIIKE